MNSPTVALKSLPFTHSVSDLVPSIQTIAAEDIQCMCI